MNTVHTSSVLRMFLFSVWGRRVQLKGIQIEIIGHVWMGYMN